MISEEVKITEFCPDVFAYLRHQDKISLEVLKESMNPEANRTQIYNSGESMGKSGAFLFFSHDRRMMIKTMTEGDFAAFKKIIPQYFAHIANNPESLIVRMYGVY
jgi:1-phosphatidylinositol-4-phosphate 5-kinase